MKKIKIITALTLMLTIGLTIIFGTTAKTYALETNEDGNIEINYEELELRYYEFDISTQSYVKIYDSSNTLITIYLESETLQTRNLNFENINTLNEMWTNIYMSFNQNQTFNYNGNNITFTDNENLTNIWGIEDNYNYTLKMNYEDQNDNINSATFKLYEIYFEVTNFYIYNETTNYYNSKPILRYKTNDMYIDRGFAIKEPIEIEDFEGISDIYTNGEYTYISSETEDKYDQESKYFNEILNNTEINLSNPEEDLQEIVIPTLEITKYITINDLINNLLNNSIWYSENNYNNMVETLTNQYNELLDKYNYLLNLQKYGAFTFLTNIEIDTRNGTINNDKIYTHNELLNSEYMQESNILVSDLWKEYIEENSPTSISDTFEMSITFEPYQIQFNNINMLIYTSYEQQAECSINVVDKITNQNINIQLTQEYFSALGENVYGFNLSYGNLNEYIQQYNLSQAYYIDGVYYSPIFIGDNTDRYTTITFKGLDSTAYTTGYNDGYNGASQLKQLEINELTKTINKNLETIENQKNKIDRIEPQLEQLQKDYEALRTNYQDLARRYSQIQSGNNDLYHMIIAVADTPINIFKQIFNFDILGINISGLVTMIISLLVIIWLIKKLI